MFKAEKFKIDVTKSRCRASTCSSSSSISTSACSIRAAARSPASSATSSSCTAACRAPRPTTQILAELQALYDLGYRGHVDFVDDNFIGNKKSLRRPCCRELKAWLEEHDYPFEFSTEASINLADDDEMLQADEGRELLRRLRRHREPGSRDADRRCARSRTPGATSPKASTRSTAAGMFVTAGFIVGFDTEKGLDRPIDDRLHRGMLRSGLHGRPALCAARTRSLRAGSPRKAGCTGPRHHAGRAVGRPMHARLQLRHQAAAARHPDRLQDRAGATCSARRPMPGGCRGCPRCSTARAGRSSSPTATSARTTASMCSTDHQRGCPRRASRSGRPSSRSARRTPARCARSSP